jgi:hypothetical protein
LNGSSAFNLAAEPGAGADSLRAGCLRNRAGVGLGIEAVGLALDSNLLTISLTGVGIDGQPY